MNTRSKARRCVERKIGESWVSPFRCDAFRRRIASYSQTPDWCRLSLCASWLSDEVAWTSLVKTLAVAACRIGNKAAATKDGWYECDRSLHIVLSDIVDISEALRGTGDEPRFAAVLLFAQMGCAVPAAELRAASWNNAAASTRSQDKSALQENKAPSDYVLGLQTHRRFRAALAKQTQSGVAEEFDRLAALTPKARKHVIESYGARRTVFQQRPVAELVRAWQEQRPTLSTPMLVSGLTLVSPIAQCIDLTARDHAQRICLGSLSCGRDDHDNKIEHYVPCLKSIQALLSHKERENDDSDDKARLQFHEWLTKSKFSSPLDLDVPRRLSVLHPHWLAAAAELGDEYEQWSLLSVKSCVGCCRRSYGTSSSSRTPCMLNTCRAWHREFAPTALDKIHVAMLKVAQRVRHIVAFHCPSGTWLDLDSVAAVHAVRCAMMRALGHYERDVRSQDVVRHDLAQKRDDLRRVALELLARVEIFIRRHTWTDDSRSALITNWENKWTYLMRQHKDGFVLDSDDDEDEFEVELPQYISKLLREETLRGIKWRPLYNVLWLFPAIVKVRKTQDGRTAAVAVNDTPSPEDIARQTKAVARFRLQIQNRIVNTCKVSYYAAKVPTSCFESDPHCATLRRSSSTRPSPIWAISRAISAGICRDQSVLRRHSG